MQKFKIKCNHTAKSAKWPKMQKNAFAYLAPPLNIQYKNERSSASKHKPASGVKRPACGSKGRAKSIYSREISLSSSSAQRRTSRRRFRWYFIFVKGTWLDLFSSRKGWTFSCQNEPRFWRLFRQSWTRHPWENFRRLQGQGWKFGPSQDFYSEILLPTVQLTVWTHFYKLLPTLFDAIGGLACIEFQKKNNRAE